MLEQLVPQDHILRKIDRYIDFSCIKDLTYDLYCHTNSRPGVDPIVLFKMLFIGYLFGIRSERQLVKDIEVNLAYRWFLGYSTNAIFKGLVDRDLLPVVAYRRSPHKKGMFTKNKFIYDFDKDIYICPNNFALIYKTTTREGYREYRCFEEICANCPVKDKCINEKSKYKIVRRHVWEDHKDDNKSFLKTEKGKNIYKRRKETVERSFADSKNLHGLRYARMRGNENVREQCLLTAAVQNMKKIATKLFSRFKEIDIDFLCYLEKYLYNFSLIYAYNYARKTLCF